MDIVEAVRSRKSIRAFKPDPVPRDVLEEIMELALRAPSWGNTQPWEFVIASGSRLDEIKQAFTDKTGELPSPDLSTPAGFPEPFDTRRRAVGIKLFEIIGIKREDREQRRLWGWPVFDCGSVAENIMLLATGYGLGTIPEIQAALYPDVLRKVLAIPDSKLIVLGIAIGYPDWDNPVNKLHSEREPLDNVATWHGFD